MKKSESTHPAQIPRPNNKADRQVDKVVTRIIRTLRRGQPAHLPGLGTINPGKPWTFDPEPGEPRNDI